MNAIDGTEDDQMWEDDSDPFAGTTVVPTILCSAIVKEPLVECMHCLSRVKHQKF